MHKHTITATFRLKGLTPNDNIVFERTYEDEWTTAEHAKQRAESKLNSFLQKWRATGWTMLGASMIFYHNLHTVTPVHNLTTTETPAPSKVPSHFRDPDGRHYTRGYVNRSSFYDGYVEIVNGNFVITFTAPGPHTSEGLAQWEKVVLDGLKTPGYLHVHPTRGTDALQIVYKGDKHDRTPSVFFVDEHGCKYSQAFLDGSYIHHRMDNMRLSVAVSSGTEMLTWTFDGSDYARFRELNQDLMQKTIAEYLASPAALATGRFQVTGKLEPFVPTSQRKTLMPGTLVKP